MFQSIAYPLEVFFQKKPTTVVRLKNALLNCFSLVNYYKRQGFQARGITVRLNAFIAAAGFCSRRKAADLVKAGQVTVNGAVLQDPSYVVQENDRVCAQGKRLTVSERYVYIMLNKPKGYVTTLADERGRRTVMDLLGNVRLERIYPIGRLDRETTGLLLLTNDGNLAHALMHPRSRVLKTYAVMLDKDLENVHIAAIKKGVYLFDGRVYVDDLQFRGAHNRRAVLVTLHSGKKRVIRRLFYSLGYDVQELERVSYAGLTARGLARGAWRYLTKGEIVKLRASLARQ